MSEPQFGVRLSVYGPEGESVLPQPQRRRASAAHRIQIDSLQQHTPKAINRFASPSCPWPWAGDTESDESRGKSRTPPQSREPSPEPGGPQYSTRDWRDYPGRQFPNWTPYVVERCGMASMFAAQVSTAKCKIYAIDVTHEARFRKVDKVVHNVGVGDSNLLAAPTGNVAEFLETRPEDVRLRCLCVEKLSGDVLQMLGAYYRLEPFYFASAINRIPSRYHEEFTAHAGDHMYITLPFLRVTKVVGVDPFSEPEIMPVEASMEESINVFAPLSLVGSDKFVKYTLQQDMLAVLLVRVPHQETLVTVHPGPIPHSARTLQDRIFMAGKGIYWGNLMRRTPDPIFVLLLVMWSALYAWDEAMEVLYTHITYLEKRVLGFRLKDVELSPQLHAIRAHLLYYDGLLEEFQKSLDFIGEVGVTGRETEGLEAAATRKLGQELLKKELRTLGNEVDRLRRQRNMQDSRLSNVMKLVLSILNIKETQTSLQHGESMKQITYLTMIYLPASFIASIFGMNVVEIVPQTNGTLAHYFAAMVPLAALTVWVAVGVSSRVEHPNAHMIHHALWPLVRLWNLLRSLGNSARKEYYGGREKLRAPQETLKHVSHPLPTSQSRTRSAVRGIPMEEQHASADHPGRSTIQKRLDASQSKVDVTARDFAQTGGFVPPIAGMSRSNNATRVPSPE